MNETIQENICQVSTQKDRNGDGDQTEEVAKENSN